MLTAASAQFRKLILKEKVHRWYVGTRPKPKVIQEVFLHNIYTCQETKLSYLTMTHQPASIEIINVFLRKRLPMLIKKTMNI